MVPRLAPKRERSERGVEMAAGKVKIKKIKNGVLKAECPVMAPAKVEAIRNSMELMGLAELQSGVIFRFAEDKKDDFVQILTKEGFEVKG